MLLREENLGLGAQVRKSNAETFGLSLFSGVLGRLNGQSDEEVQKQQGALRDAELRTYQAQKYGFMNFVSGGLLVGDSIEPVTGGSEDGSQKRVTGDAKGKEERSAKKRKGREEAIDPEGNIKMKKGESNSESKYDAAPLKLDNNKAGERNKPKSKKRDRNAQVQTVTRDSCASTKNTDDVEQSRAVLVPSKATEDSSTDNLGGKGVTENRRKKPRKYGGAEGSTQRADDGKRSHAKKERRSCKEERRKRKEVARESKLLEKQAIGLKPIDKKRPTPARDPTTFNGNRHAVRQRYIQQKKMASLDPQAMKEIFMLKAAV